MAVNTFVNVNSLSANDKEKLRHVIVDLNDSMTRSEAEHEYQKEAINNVAEALNIDKKIVRRMARTYFKANYNTEVEENRAFEEFYTGVLNTVASPDPTIV